MKIINLINMFLKKNYNVIIGATIVVATIAVAGVFLHNRQQHQGLVIGFVADIHAGNQDRRLQGIEPNNILLPQNFEKNLRSALDKIRNSDMIIALGDELNNPSEKYLLKLKEVAKGFPMIWVKGNHDSKILFKELSPRNYYYIDKKNWRIIILDNSESFPDHHGDDFNNHGYIDTQQLDWLKNALKTSRNVLVAMHAPMLDRNDLNSFRPDQEELANLLKESGNVKYVLAGHYHVYNWQIEKDGIQYLILPSISLEGGEGYYMRLKLE